MFSTISCAGTVTAWPAQQWTPTVAEQLLSLKIPNEFVTFDTMQSQSYSL